MKRTAVRGLGMMLLHPVFVLGVSGMLVVHQASQSMEEVVRALPVVWGIALSGAELGLAVLGLVRGGRHRQAARPHGLIALGALMLTVASPAARSALPTAPLPPDAVGLAGALAMARGVWLLVRTATTTPPQAPAT